MIWNEKIFLVNEAKKLNLYNTEWFSWIDAGVCIYRYKYPPEIIWGDIDILNTLPKNKFIYTTSDTDIINFDLIGTYYHIISGCFLIHESFIDIFKEIYKKYCEKLLIKNDWIYTDQVINTIIYKDNSELYFLAGHGYGNILPLLYSKKYDIPKLFAGLGNQLFQFFTVYGLSRHNNKLFCVNKDYTLKSPHSNIDYNKTIFKNYIMIENNELQYNEPENEVFLCNDFLFNNEIIKKNNILYHGYYQNSKYFHKFYDRICIMFREMFSIDNKYKNYYFIHFRHNDNIPTNTLHYIDLTNYYNNALDVILEKDKECENILIISDEFEKANHFYNSIINRINSIFKNIQYINTDEITTMKIISSCGKGGIISNSTFSWWGLYIGHEDKLCIIPNKMINKPYSTIYIPNSIIINT
jgi:hypothetical protein